jgi:hypothetical protein
MDQREWELVTFEGDQELESIPSSAEVAKREVYEAALLHLRWSSGSERLAGLPRRRLL